MNLSIGNPGRIMAADITTLGAAVKIILAGGSALTEAEMQRATGASAYVWKTRRADIIGMVRDLEPQGA